MLSVGEFGVGVGGWWDRGRCGRGGRGLLGCGGHVGGGNAIPLL